jgi:hypothetical protein
VIAANKNVQEMTPEKAMETCLMAEDFPPAIFPTYIPN